MLWLSKHARYRISLSPYIDGQLPAHDRKALESHLAGCDACRRELDEMRSAISAIGGLQSADPPRSFAVTRELLERRPDTRPVEPAPPVAVGMRLAGAAAALALAVVVVGDLGGVGGGMGDNEGAAGGTVAERSMELAAAEGEERDSAPEAPAATSIAGDISASEPEPVDETSAAFGGVDGCLAPADAAGGAGAGAGESGPGGPASAPSPTAEPAPTSSPAPAPQAEAPAVDCPPGAAEQLQEATEGPGAIAAVPEPDSAEDGEAASAASDDDGGLPTLTILEIVLAGALAALLLGVIVETALRRRRAV